MKPTSIPDPLEDLILAALRASELNFERPSPTDLDFYIPALNLHIEVTAFHTPRKIEQLSRAPNVILLQGRTAVEFFATILTTISDEYDVPSMIFLKEPRT